jgi:hypothetical protein
LLPIRDGKHKAQFQPHKKLTNKQCCGSALVSNADLDPDPAFYLKNADPDPGIQTNADPDPILNQTLRLLKVESR